MEEWIGYFTCPMCNKKTLLEGWRTREGDNVEITFTALFSKSISTYRKMVIECPHCNAKWEMGVEPVEKKDKEGKDDM